MRFVFLAVLLAAPVLAQTPTFEVAVIKPAPPLSPQLVMAGKMRIGMKVDAGRVEIGFSSLRDLIVLAYEVKPFQVQGPDWFTQDRWDVVAKMPEGATHEQVPAMLRALLEDRFHLKARRETREQNVYALEQAKGGHKLKEAPPAEPEATAPPAADSKNAIAFSAGNDTVRVVRNGSSPDGSQNVSVSTGKNGRVKVNVGADGQMHMDMERTTMPDFAQMLSPMLDRPVVDRTGLAGAWQVSLEIAMQDMQAMARASGMMAAGGRMPMAGPADSLAPSDPGGSVFSSIDKLGLHLTRTKAPMELVVVDSADKAPTEN